MFGIAVAGPQWVKKATAKGIVASQSPYKGGDTSSRRVLKV